MISPRAPFEGNIPLGNLGMKIFSYLMMQPVLSNEIGDFIGDVRRKMYFIDNIWNSWVGIKWIQSLRKNEDSI